MDGRLLLRLERCLGCQSLFLICRCCYHGHTYCSDDCRKPARASQLRGIRAAHQASPGAAKTIVIAIARCANVIASCANAQRR